MSAFYFVMVHSFFLEVTVVRFVRPTDKTALGRFYASCPLGSFEAPTSGKELFVKGPQVKD